MKRCELCGSYQLWLRDYPMWSCLPQKSGGYGRFGGYPFDSWYDFFCVLYQLQLMWPLCRTVAPQTSHLENVRDFDDPDEGELHSKQSTAEVEYLDPDMSL